MKFFLVQERIWCKTELRKRIQMGKLFPISMGNSFNEGHFAIDQTLYKYSFLTFFHSSNLEYARLTLMPDANQQINAVKNCLEVFILGRKTKTPSTTDTCECTNTPPMFSQAYSSNHQLQRERERKVILIVDY